MESLDKKMNKVQCQHCNQTFEEDTILRSIVFKNIKTDEEESYSHNLCYSCFENAVDLVSQSDEIVPFCLDCHAELKIPEEMGKTVECRC